jgi:hypothetical protein
MRNPIRKISILVSGVLGLTLLFALPGAAMARDRNHDRIPDRWERHHNLSLKVKQTRRDQDRDGLKNLAEFHQGTNPQDADTDNDGLGDGQEVESGDDPTDSDTDNDGVNDGHEHPGTIASYDSATGTLVINVFNHDPLSGQVTDATEISCDSQGDQGDEGDSTGAATSSDESGDSPTGDDDQGENEGDQGENDQGDDDQGDSSCSVADLVPGTVVHEAKLSVSGDGAVWDEVQLVK